MSPGRQRNRTPLLKGSLKNLFFPPEQDEYAYFKAAGQFPFVVGDRYTRAAWAADASMLSYARYGARRMSDEELKACLAAGGLTLRKKIGENPENWNASGTQAFFAEGDGFAMLAFRGTEADDPQDLLDDLDLLPSPEWQRPGWPCFVHRGFQRALGRVWEQVLEQLEGYRRENPEADICITGHSLGGALALLTFSRYRVGKVSAYTFGCPRVGNGSFGARVADVGLGHFRFVNFNDLVTHVPLESELYLHAPRTCYRFDDAGLLDEEHLDSLSADFGVLERLIKGLPADFVTHPQQLDDVPAPPGLVDHSPARYCMRLWDRVSYSS